MDLVGGFLSKYKKILDKGLLINDVVVLAFKEVLNIKIEKSDIVYKDGIIKIKSSPIIKSEMILQQEALIGYIKEKLPNISIVKIH
ncbi:MAG: hypothetical protein K8Q91_00555 [Candidatus Vogelbacteria bacterium]|nr:hypothetical protein [Candidatus Vogelbacteria bacterium]